MGSGNQHSRRPEPGRRVTHSPSAHSWARPRAGFLVLAGAGRSADAHPGHVDLVDLLEAAGGVGGQHARQAGGEPGSDHDRQVLGPGGGVEGEQAGDVVGGVGRRHDRRPAARASAARARWSPAGPVSMTDGGRAADGGEDRLEVGADGDGPSERRDHRLAAGGVGVDDGQVVDRPEGEELAGGPGADGPDADDDRPHQCCIGGGRCRRARASRPAGGWRPCRPATGQRRRPVRRGPWPTGRVVS